MREFMRVVPYAEGWTIRFSKLIRVPRTWSDQDRKYCDDTIGRIDGSSVEPPGSWELGLCS